MNRASTIHPPAGVKIAGTGIAVPERVLTNADLEKIVDTSDEWIVQRTGIRERRIVDEQTSTTDLATEAARMAIEHAGLKPGELDLVICATITPEMLCPASACRVVDNLGAIPCGAMDVSIACTGFVAALNMAANFVRTGMYRHIVAIGADALSEATDWEDRRTCVLFGDGAGAAVVSASDDPEQGCVYQTMHSDGGKWRELYLPRKPRDLPDEGGPEFTGKFNTLQMNGREIYKFAVNTMQASIEDAMDACGLTPADVKIVIPHQSNARILTSARDKLGLDEDKMYINIDRYGNTSAASAGMCLHELMAAGRLEKGDYVVLVALGGGLSWGSSVWRL